MSEECLICGSPLVYAETDTLMECAICHKKAYSKAACEKGHYVCDACHTGGMDALMGVCLSSPSKNPVEIIRQLMALPSCHMHGPEHHIMVGSSLLTAYHNAGGKIDLEKSFGEMQTRGTQVPGGACGFWGACGAGISTGIFLSIVTGATPLKNEEWALSNQMTAEALSAIAALGGPRCCKRNSYTAIKTAVAFVKTHLGIEMVLDETIRCLHSPENNQCIKERCPFH